MIQLFFKTAFRNLIKQKRYAALNIFGLALGITSCLLIFQYVSFERSYDRFEPQAGQLYRIQLEDYQNGRLAVKCASNYAALAPALKTDFPEVASSTHFFITRMTLSNEAKNIRFRETGIYYAEPAFLNLFGVHLLEGDPATALQGPFKIVIPAPMAQKYFGTTHAVGKTLNWQAGGSQKPFLVTGVSAPFPVNSHLNFTALVSYNTFSSVNGTAGMKDDPVETSWYWTDFYTYVRLTPGTDPQKFQAKLPAFADSHINHLPDNLANHDRSVLQLIAAPDIHLYSHYTEEATPTGDGRSVAFLFLTGFFILSIAWVNYTNMATARSLDRAREVGVRKVLGALRRDLIGQFLMESLLLNLLALAIAVAFSLLLAKPFVNLTGRPLAPLAGLRPAYIGGFALIFLTGTFLSGLYPAIVLSGYQPATVLKGAFKNSFRGQWLRKGLIVGQFAISIGLIAATIVIYRQVQFMRSQSLGADIGSTLAIYGAGSVSDSVFERQYKPFKNELLALPGVKSITSSSNIMGQEILWGTNWKNLHGQNAGWNNIFLLGVDADFIPAFRLQLKAGRNFSEAFPGDKKRAILNATAARTLAFSSPEAALHQTVVSSNDDTLEVAGVVADFHQEGLQKEITPLIMLLNNRARVIYSVKVDAAHQAQSTAAIRRIWSRYFPADPFQYFYLDEFFGTQYDENRRFGQVFGFFSLLAVVIACFGLLALSAYTVRQRTKEIGVRKVLGATMGDLVLILSRDFLLLVAMAFLLAVPLSFLAMHQWLASFAYRAPIAWWIYALAGILAFGTAFITVGWQAVKAGRANPVNSLRSE